MVVELAVAILDEEPSPRCSGACAVTLSLTIQHVWRSRVGPQRGSTAQQKERSKCSVKHMGMLFDVNPTRLASTKGRTNEGIRRFRSKPIHEGVQDLRGG